MLLQHQIHFPLTHTWHDEGAEGCNEGSPKLPQLRCLGTDHSLGGFETYRI